MTFDIFNCIGFYVIGLLVIASIIAKHAPYGWEDKDGFHYGKKGKK